jgi:glucosylceramidase
MSEKRSYSIDSSEVFLTAESGEKNTRQKSISFSSKSPRKSTTLEINTQKIKQSIDGIGTSFTEASAFVLANLGLEQRNEVMQRIFGVKGANVTLTRTHIGSCDFSVEGRSSYCDVEGDIELKHFSIECDKDGFDAKIYPGIKDPHFDLLPMIQEAQAIKTAQGDDELKIIASAWTAPPWMKNNGDWFVPGTSENNWQGSGGALKHEHYATYANYLIKYLQTYRKEGVKLWGLTPVNEPCGNNGQWESLHFTPQEQKDFVTNHLGPQLHAQGFADVKLLVYDQNRDQMEEWAETLFTDLSTASYCYGLAVHWYSSTVNVYENVFNKIHDRFPTQRIIHTEGCIDDLGKDAPDGIGDPLRFKESDWFANDDFWWNANATDWAYTANWQGVNAADHPIYTPVHRYARDIIVGINNWLNGWIDWNIVLDRNGGPNHAGNFCGAPIMIDTLTGEIYYTPVFHILSQLSRTIRPGDRAVACEISKSGLGKDDLHACATLNEDNLLSVQILNTTKTPQVFSLQIDKQIAEVTIAANALQTIRVQLP